VQPAGYLRRCFIRPEDSGQSFGFGRDMDAVAHGSGVAVVDQEAGHILAEVARKLNCLSEL
jgi:hypothetical protein